MFKNNYSRSFLSLATLLCGIAIIVGPFLSIWETKADGKVMATVGNMRSCIRTTATNSLKNVLNNETDHDSENGLQEFLQPNLSCVKNDNAVESFVSKLSNRLFKDDAQVYPKTEKTAAGFLIGSGSMLVLIALASMFQQFPFFTTVGSLWLPVTTFIVGFGMFVFAGNKRYEFASNVSNASAGAGLILEIVALPALLLISGFWYVFNRNRTLQNKLI